MAGRQDRVEGLGVERDAGEPVVVLARRAPVLDGDGHVHLPVQDHKQALVALGVPHPDPDAGRGAGERREGGSDHEADAGGEGGDRDRACLAGAVGGELGLGALQLGQDGVGVLEQDLAGRGEAGAPGAALDQAVTGLLLQGGELLGDGGGVR